MVHSDELLCSVADHVMFFCGCDSILTEYPKYLILLKGEQINGIRRE